MALTLAQAVSELEALGVMPEGQPSLAPVARALEQTGLRRRIDPARNVIVAGTNGKGTVAATLSALLHASGRRAGLYTSPHLVSTLERFRLAEADVPEPAFLATYDRLRPVIRHERLTHFEALTLIAAHLFFSGDELAPVEWAIWEVGMGGLFDAVNAIPHSACAITHLDLDHTELLGRTLPEVARQKFGVIGRGAWVVFSPMDPTLARLREDVASKTGCTWIPARPVDLVGPERVSTAWGPASLALAGRRAAENTATALTLLEALGLDPRAALPALARVRWPGRFHRWSAPGFRCPVYLSGDHNVSGVESLLEILESRERDVTHLVVGIGRDKDAEAMLDRLSAVPRSRLYLTETPFKGLPVASYPERFRARAATVDADASRALDAARAAALPGDLVVVTGSLYLVGHMLSHAPQASLPRGG